MHYTNCAINQEIFKKIDINENYDSVKENLKILLNK